MVGGRHSDSLNVGLDEPVTEIESNGEGVLGPVKGQPSKTGEGIFDLIARLPGGNRSKEHIDRQIREERESWGDR